VSARFTVKVNDNVDAYTNISYYQNNTYVDYIPQQIQNSVSLNTNNIALPPTLPGGALNPNNPFAAAGQYALIQYAFGDIQDLNILKNHNARWVTGLKGNPLGIALGAEIRYEAQADPALNPNNEVQGLGIAQTAGSRRVEAAYFEFGIPVIKMLNFDVSGRYDHYSDFGSAFTPKAGFKFTPIKEVAILRHRVLVQRQLLSRGLVH